MTKIKLSKKIIIIAIIIILVITGISFATYKIVNDENKLKSVGLELPFTYKLQHELKKEGYSLDLVMSTKEMVKEICQLNTKK